MTTASVDSSFSSYQMEFDHSEEGMRALSALTVDPIKSVLYYLIPWIGAYISNQIQIRVNDKVQISLFPEALKNEIIQKIDALRIAAGIDRKVDCYTSLNFRCSGYGGSHSITDPIVSVPAAFLIVPSRSLFSTTNSPIEQKDKKWIFNSDEVSFFIAREMAQIKSNDVLFRIVTKILFIAALFFIWVLPVSILYGTSMIVGSIALYAYSEKVLQGELDISASEILKTHFNDQTRAYRAALCALEKIREQNLERRGKNQLCQYYISKDGNNLLDLSHPFLTTRIQRIKDHFAAMALSQST